MLRNGGDTSGYECSYPAARVRNSLNVSFPLRIRGTFFDSGSLNMQFLWLSSGESDESVC